MNDYIRYALIVVMLSCMIVSAWYSWDQAERVKSLGCAAVCHCDLMGRTVYPSYSNNSSDPGTPEYQWLVNRSSLL